MSWFKVHRELFESELWNDVSTFRLFLYLIAQATHQDGIKTKGIELKRGQYVRSYRKLADDLSYKEGRGFKKYSLSTIKSCVNKLIEAERVNVKETEVGTLFTILNYSKYQALPNEQKQSPNALNDKPRTCNENEGLSTKTPNAVKQSILRTPNVNRTEPRTEESVIKQFNDKGLKCEIEKSPNTLTEKVRTNSELTPNEVRTNSEQEQELKNLRIKENNIYTATELNYGDEYYLCFQSHMNAFQREEINSYLDDGLSDEVICAAFRKAAENGAKYPYAKSIINNWAKKGIKSLEDVEREQQSFRARKQQSKQTKRKGAVRTEMLPDWFDEHEQKDKPKLKVVEDTDNKMSEFEKLMEQRKKMSAGS